MFSPTVTPSPTTSSSVELQLVTISSEPVKLLATRKPVVNWTIFMGRKMTYRPVSGSAGTYSAAVWSLVYSAVELLAVVWFAV